MTCLNYLFLRGMLIKLRLPAEDQEGQQQQEDGSVQNFSSAGAVTANLKSELCLLFEA